MRGSYRMMDWELEKVKSLLVKGINSLASGYEEEIDFTGEDVNANNLIEGLEALGYHLEDSEYNHDDFYWYLSNKDYYICIKADVCSFSLKMFLMEEEI